MAGKGKRDLSGYIAKCMDHPGMAEVASKNRGLLSQQPSSKRDVPGMPGKLK